MFFRRARPKKPTIAERLEKLRQSGFHVTPLGSGIRASREGCAVMIEESGGQPKVAGCAGILSGEEIGVLVDGGFQKFFQTPGGKRRPARASELHALHDFEADLREALGLESLYNESLGTVSTLYLYDRVQDRDAGVPKRVWES